MTENAPTFPDRRAKTPPFLLLAALLFWGWQSGFLLAGALVGVVLESARFIKARWDLTERGFSPHLEFLHAAGAGAGGLTFSPPTRRAAA